MSEKIYTQHPDPEKQGVKIDKVKYDQMREAIRNVMLSVEQTTFKELAMAVRDVISPEFEGSIEWYLTTLKLDLESRGEMTCDRKKSPNVLRWTGE